MAETGVASVAASVVASVVAVVVVAVVVAVEGGTEFDDSCSLPGP